MDVYDQFANFYSVIFLLSDPSVFVPQIYGTLQIRYHHFKKNQVLFRFLVKMSAVRLFSGADFYSIGIYRQLLWGESRTLFGFLCVQRCFPKKRHSSAKSHCQQPFWAWENYSEELKHPPPEITTCNRKCREFVKIKSRSCCLISSKLRLLYF